LNQAHQLPGESSFGGHTIQQKLATEQQEIFLTIQSFLSKAKEALSIMDFPRAFNLADKAQVLANELFRALR